VRSGTLPVKALAWVAGIVVLVLAVIIVYVLTNSAALIAHSIERYGALYLGVAVDVAEVSVALTDGTATVHGLVVGNPGDFSGPPALAVDELRIVLDMGRTSSGLIVLVAVVIENARVTALSLGRESNLQLIMDHLNARIDAHERARQIRVVSEVRLIIQRLAFTGATATVVSDHSGPMRVDLPPVHLSNIGENGGASVGQALRQVLEPVIRSVPGLEDVNNQDSEE
jgi:hypothetical protein